MQTILNRYSCWRHGRGFGIHSPFAFSLITEVLRQKLPFYGYADISRDRRMRLLYRLVVRFRPRRVMIVSSQPALLEATVCRASRLVSLVDSAPDMLVADAVDCSADAIGRLLRPGMSALILNADKSTRAVLSEAMPCGMLFDNRHGTMVIAALEHLPRQDFDVKF